MAIDSSSKRAAVTGVGRPWARAVGVGTIDAAKRASIGNVYPVATFATPAVVVASGDEKKFLQPILSSVLS